MPCVVTFSNMKPSFFHERHQLETTLFVEIKVWRVPKPVRGSRHDFKYSLVGLERRSVLRFDNEAGKGDHFHIGELELQLPFHRRRTVAGHFGGRSMNGDDHARSTSPSGKSDDVTGRALAAFNGEQQGHRISFASPELLWQTLTAKRQSCCSDDRSGTDERSARPPAGSAAT
ncbi:MAG: DUF6516 family protein [Geminicoccaceae bacterium]